MKVHGTSVSIDGDGVLFRGPSGSGKSDLALRVIYHGGQLVADDQVCMSRRKDQIFIEKARYQHFRHFVGCLLLSVNFTSTG